MTKKLFTFFAALCASAMLFAQDYLCFTAEVGGSKVSMESVGTDWQDQMPAIEYSTDGVAWRSFAINQDTVLLVKSGDKVYFRGQGEPFSFGATRYIRFTMAGTISASGTIMSLVDPTCEATTLHLTGTFVGLFENCAALKSAPMLTATTLTPYCYQNMFAGCDHLEESPYLPALQLCEYSYAGMFKDCSIMNKMDVAFERWNPANATLNWVEGVPEEGTFVCPQTLDSTKMGVSFVPYNWTRSFEYDGTPGLWFVYSEGGKFYETPIDEIDSIKFDRVYVSAVGHDVYQMEMRMKEGVVMNVLVEDIDSLSIIGYVNEEDNEEAANYKGRMFVNNNDMYLLNQEDIAALPILGLEGTELMVDGKNYDFTSSTAVITFTTNRLFSSFTIAMCACEYPFIWEEAGEKLFEAGSKEHTFKAVDGRDSIVTCSAIDRESYTLSQIFSDVVALDEPMTGADSFQWYRNGQLIAGANKQYYQQIGGLDGTYYVVVNPDKENEIISCSMTFKKAAVAKEGISKALVDRKIIIITTGGIYDGLGNRLK